MISSERQRPGLWGPFAAFIWNFSNEHYRRNRLPCRRSKGLGLMLPSIHGRYVAFILPPSRPAKRRIFSLCTAASRLAAGCSAYGVLRYPSKVLGASILRLFRGKRWEGIRRFGRNLAALCQFDLPTRLDCQRAKLCPSQTSATVVIFCRTKDSDYAAPVERQLSGDSRSGVSINAHPSIFNCLCPEYDLYLPGPVERQRRTGHGNL